MHTQFNPKQMESCTTNLLHYELSLDTFLKTSTYKIKLKVLKLRFNPKKKNNNLPVNTAKCKIPTNCHNPSHFRPYLPSDKWF